MSEERTVSARDLEEMLRDQNTTMEKLSSRHFEALKKVILMEILLTMDLPRDRIQLTGDNVRWLLDNVEINNSDHPKLDEVISNLEYYRKGGGSLRKCV